MKLNIKKEFPVVIMKNSLLDLIIMVQVIRRVVLIIVILETLVKSQLNSPKIFLLLVNLRPPQSKRNIKRVLNLEGVLILRMSLWR